MLNTTLVSADAGFLCVVSAAGYAVLALVAVLTWRRRGKLVSVPSLPPVSVLKPLCGAEPGLYENLRSFCRQEFGTFEIVFGVSDWKDSALEVVRGLQEEFPELSIVVEVNSKQHGSNCKISNLINMVARARYDVLVMADSDACVDPNYLSIVTAPLRDESVGLVTSLYRAVPTPSVQSRIGAMYINEWYMPSVMIAWLFGYEGYVSGQTLCMRRQTLQAVGGLESIANHLADDHELGARVRRAGKRVVLSAYIPSAECHETSWQSLIRHETRWMRTLYVLRPQSYRFIFFSFSVPLASLGVALAETVSAPTWILLSTIVAARVGLYLIQGGRGKQRVLQDLWLIPVRDFLLCWVWGRSLFTSRITWRGNKFNVDEQGVMHRLP